VVSSCDLLGARQPVTMGLETSPDAVMLANNITRENETHPSARSAE
jgi:hypothetical protein